MTPRCATCDFYVPPDATNVAMGLCRFLGPGLRRMKTEDRRITICGSGLVYVDPAFGCVAHKHTPGAQITAKAYRDEGYRMDVP